MGAALGTARRHGTAAETLEKAEKLGVPLGIHVKHPVHEDQTLPVYVVHSTFGGTADLGNEGANGGALSSIGVSWTVLNSLFTHNRAIGHGANSGNGGNGGAIYNDGNTYTLNVCGSRFTENLANEGGGAIFYVSNDESGTLIVNDSYLVGNPSLEFETLPGMFVIAGSTDYSGSTIEE